jgi:thioredoxin-dependent peroxiredoxin
MTIQLGDDAPDFTADTTDGLIRFHEWKGSSWVMLFSHPGDFTPVCTTELGAVGALKSEFDERNTKVIGVSVDPLNAHYRWRNDVKRVTGAELNFPIVADSNGWVASLYGMVHPLASSTHTTRSTFIIGPDNKVCLVCVYPESTGRNFREMLRVIDSLQLAAKYPIATPADWRDGEDVIIATGVSDDQAKALFPKGFDAKTPYLRMTPQPNK